MWEKLTDHKNIQCGVDVWMDKNLGKCKWKSLYRHNKCIILTLPLDLYNHYCQYWSTTHNTCIYVCRTIFPSPCMRSRSNGTGSFCPESRSPPESFCPESCSPPESFRPYSCSPRVVSPLFPFAPGRLAHCCMTPDFLRAYAARPASRGIVDSFDTIWISVAGH